TRCGQPDPAFEPDHLSQSLRVKPTRANRNSRFWSSKLKTRTIVFCLLALLFVSAGMFSFVTHAQIDNAESARAKSQIVDKSAGEPALVLTRNAQGQVTCRAATPAEARNIQQRRGEGVVI